MEPRQRDPKVAKKPAYISYCRRCGGMTGCCADSPERGVATRQGPLVDWVIVGGESGPRSRPMDAEWVHSLCDQCAVAGVAFFFKQWGGRDKKAAGRELDGRTWNELPSI